MNQGKLVVVKQEMARVNINILGVSVPNGWECVNLIQMTIISTIVSKMKLLSCAQLCLTLCKPMDCSLPGSSVHGIFQARVLEWVSIFFSNCG